MSGREVISLILLFAVARVNSDDPKPFDKDKNVEIDGTTVTLICPEDSAKWEKEGKEAEGEKTENKLVINKYTDKNNGLYHCVNSDSTVSKQKYYFYTKLKVCEGCVEMDMSYSLGIVIGDIMITVGVVILIYMCAKKKAGPAPHQRAAHSRQTGAPPPPEPDYQSLNQATRSRDVYAEARRKN
ncbi:hypothetical protein NFI96_012940 [Prochilodus magdalenae]|nr:hypothetical protein NFI96_012940 [Prochilodus magdalenae]